MPVKFDWALITGQIGWKFTEITLYACLVKFGGHNLNGFTPNSTGHLKALTGNVISMDLHPIRLVEFDWHLKALTGNVISMDLHPI